MTRIVPWTLPPVKGGSIGGYTPAGDDADPTPTDTYFNFEDVVFKSISGGITYDDTIFIGPAGGGLHIIPVGESELDAALCTISTDGCWMEGLEVVDLTGVNHVTASITAAKEVSSGLTVETAGFTILIDPTTGAISDISGKMKFTATQSVYASSYILGISEVIFDVYNDNGEVIQTYTMDVSA